MGPSGCSHESAAMPVLIRNKYAVPLTLPFRGILTADLTVLLTEIGGVKRWLAHHLNRRLLETDAAGRFVRPGGAAQRRWRQADRGDVTIIARGDAFDLYIGRKEVYNVTLSVRTAKELGFWLARWWVFATWCGFKHRLWYWSLGVLLENTDGAARKKPAALGERQSARG